MININKCLTDEGILPSNQRKVIEQAKFTYSLFGKALEIQRKTIEGQGKKQIKTIHYQGEKQIRALENRLQKKIKT